MMNRIYFFACQQCEFRGMHFFPEEIAEYGRTMEKHRAATGHVFVTWTIEPRNSRVPCDPPGDNDPFGEWLRSYLADRERDKPWTTTAVEEAFEAGRQVGWDEATGYYRTGGSFK